MSGLHDINVLISPALGVVVTSGLSISDSGYIAAQCTFPVSINHACLLKPNLILILKQNIFALEQNDPGCIQCKTVLDPEANSLPDTLTDLTPEQQKQVVAAVGTIIVQLRQLESAGEITARQTRLLVHQSKLVLAALGAT